MAEHVTSKEKLDGMNWLQATAQYGSRGADKKGASALLREIERLQRELDTALLGLAAIAERERASHEPPAVPATPDELARDIERKLIVAVREADDAFQKAGATGTKSWIRDFLLGRLEAHGLGVGAKDHVRASQPPGAVIEFTDPDNGDEVTVCPTCGQSHIGSSRDELRQTLGLPLTKSVSMEGQPMGDPHPADLTRNGQCPVCGWPVGHCNVGCTAGETSGTRK